MSSTFIPAASLHRSARVAPTSTRLRLTRRGRAVLTSVVAVPLAAVVAFAMLNGGTASAARGDSSASATLEHTSFETVVVAPGETLWAIAGQVAPTADPRDVVDAIVRLNALDSAGVIAGQELAIPAKYAPAE